ncbi:MAG: hypothetical protein HC836_47990 [Richelia sp. RM2_1_2]|nr:hypothetical protein [Richelia sp. RM2_1_2]
METVGIARCPFCPLTFRRQSLFTKHVLKDHKKPDDPIGLELLPVLRDYGIHLDLKETNIELPDFDATYTLNCESEDDEKCIPINHDVLQRKAHIPDSKPDDLMLGSPNKIRKRRKTDDIEFISEYPDDSSEAESNISDNTKYKDFKFFSKETAFTYRQRRDAIQTLFQDEFLYLQEFKKMLLNSQKNKQNKDDCQKQTALINNDNEDDEDEDDEEELSVDLEDNIPFDYVLRNTCVPDQFFADTVDDAVHMLAENSDFTCASARCGDSEISNALLNYIEKHEDGENKKVKSVGLAELELLDMLDQSNAPLHLFEDILKWTRHASIVHKYDFQKNIPSRRTVIGQIIHQTNLRPLTPTAIQLTLPNAKTTVNIITHDIGVSIYSLLSDKSIMQEKNLIFKDNPLEDPFARESNPCINDINDGQCYIEAYRRYCQDPSKDVLCPLIFFIDKTHVDVRGNQTLEPVSFTLGIFNQATRNRDDAWRIIGYVPSSDLYATKGTSSSQKYQDYHAILCVIFANLVKLQAAKGLAWELDFNGTKYNVNLKIPILFITGDAEGLDKIVGRRLQYSKFSDEKIKSVQNQKQHICRYCDVKFGNLDNPYYESIPFSKDEKKNLQFDKNKGFCTKASKIKKYLDEGKDRKLGEMGYLNVKKNVFHELKFCDSKHGVNGSVPADLLHTFQLGIYSYAIESLFQQKKY